MRGTLCVVLLASSGCWRISHDALVQAKGYSYKHSIAAGAEGYDPAGGCEAPMNREGAVLTQGTGSACVVLASRVYGYKVDWPGGQRPTDEECVGSLTRPDDSVVLVRRTTSPNVWKASRRVEDRFVDEEYLALHHGERAVVEHPRFRPFEMNGPALDQLPLAGECGLRDEVDRVLAPRVVAELTAERRAAGEAPSLPRVVQGLNRTRRVVRLLDTPPVRALRAEYLARWKELTLADWPITSELSPEVEAELVSWLERRELDPKASRGEALARRVESSAEVASVVSTVEVGAARAAEQRDLARVSPERGASDAALPWPRRLEAIAAAMRVASRLPAERARGYFAAWGPAGESLARCSRDQACRERLPKTLPQAFAQASAERFAGPSAAVALVLADEGAVRAAVAEAWRRAADEFSRDGAAGLAALCRLRAELLSPVSLDPALAARFKGERVLGSGLLPQAGLLAVSLTGPLEKRSTTERRTVRKTRVVEERKPKDGTYAFKLRNIDFRIQQARAELVTTQTYKTRECKPGFDTCTEVKGGGNLVRGDDAAVEALLEERKALVAEYETPTRREEAFDDVEFVTTWELEQTLSVTLDGKTEQVRLKASASTPELPRSSIVSAIVQAGDALLKARTATLGASSTAGAVAALEARARGWLAEPLAQLPAFEAELVTHPTLSR